ncbi:YbdD/YjiX family protein [Corynebacterium epidermidicanis]|uniref:YbdD/YjiX family protein n=1 Tax=Corynebacterium epidermidicanis TaxID=1050174 RepID=UPI000A05F168|nr:YbdD/YjiX family protein [Corynebacterium epidermidicanis]
MRTLKAVWWWLGELVGEREYEKYVAHLRARHPGHPIPSEREYFRQRFAEKDANPGARCC